MLYRQTCPEQMTLGEYALNLLEETAAAAVADHVRTCPHCQADLQQIRQFIDQPLPTEATAAQTTAVPLAERIKIIVLDLLSTAMAPSTPTLQPAFRGEEDEMPTHVFYADGYVAALSLPKDSAAWPRKRLIGDVTALDEEPAPFLSWTAYLWQAGKLLATAALDEAGHFSFEPLELAAEPHTLILSGPDLEIHLQNLHLSDLFAS